MSRTALQAAAAVSICVGVGYLNTVGLAATRTVGLSAAREVYVHGFPFPYMEREYWRDPPLARNPFERAVGTRWDEFPGEGPIVAMRPPVLVANIGLLLILMLAADVQWRNTSLPCLNTRMLMIATCVVAVVLVILPVAGQRLWWTCCVWAASNAVYALWGLSARFRSRIGTE